MAHDTDTESTEIDQEKQLWCETPNCNHIPLSHTGNFTAIYHNWTHKLPVREKHGKSDIQTRHLSSSNLYCIIGNNLWWDFNVINTTQSTMMLLMQLVCQERATRTPFIGCCQSVIPYVIVLDWKWWYIVLKHLARFHFPFWITTAGSHRIGFSNSQGDLEEKNPSCCWWPSSVRSET